MARYIDADDHLEYLQGEILLWEKRMHEATDTSSFFQAKRVWTALISAKARLQRSLAADVEEVVRCRDCRFWHTKLCWAKRDPSKNDFCSFGAKMEAEYGNKS